MELTSRKRKRDSPLPNRIFIGMLSNCCRISSGASRTNSKAAFGISNSWSLVSNISSSLSEVHILSSFIAERRQRIYAAGSKCRQPAGEQSNHHQDRGRSGERQQVRRGHTVQ